VRHTLVLGLCAALALAMFLLERRITMPATATTESARDMLGPPAVIPLATPEPPAKIVVDQPVPEALARGQVFIQYRTENLRIEPVFGPTALGVTPRIGHIHVVLDNAPWHWADASGEPLIIVGLPPGPHEIDVTLADANHHFLDRAAVSFVVPDTSQHRPS
jgi:Family of unknown function (DUF6130)